ncbi:MAG: hypothetical protein IAF58_21450, partial [Leptolyngbya sp.]|nr:hypothetical protein [Candidatus Melainabacteria bacterium]
RSSTDKKIWTPSEYQRPQRIGLAQSNDLHKWERHPISIGKPIIDNPGPGGIFDGVAWRDPYVIRFGEKYLCFVCARITPGSQEFQAVQWDSGGCIACLESSNLTDWDLETAKVIVSPSDFYEMETPQFFWRIDGDKKRYYLLFSSWAKGISQKRRSECSEEECQTGTYYTVSNIVDKDDWTIPSFQAKSHLLAANLYGGKIIEPESEQPVFFGFPMLDSAGHFMGGLSDPLKAHFLNSGAIEIGA